MGLDRRLFGLEAVLESLPVDWPLVTLEVPSSETRGKMEVCGGWLMTDIYSQTRSR
jgi:hypothetical protein